MPKPYVEIRKDIDDFLNAAGNILTLDATPDQRVQCIITALFMVSRERGASQDALEIIAEAHAKLFVLNDKPIDKL